MRAWKMTAVIAGFLALIPVQGLGQDSEATALARLSFSSGWDGLPAIVAIERGFFDQEGLVVSGLAVSSAQAVLESVAVGSTDFAAIPQRTLLLMAAAEIPAKVVSMNNWGTQTELVVPAADGTVQSIADLKGKTIAVGTASEAYPILIRLLNRAGLRPGDVTIKTLAARDIMGLFENEGADAVFESRYFTKVLTDNGQGRVVLKYEDIVKQLGVIGAMPLVANATVVEKEPETVQKFVNAWVKALVYIEQDPEDAARLLTIFFHRQGVKVPQEMAVSWVGMTHYDRYSWSAQDVADAEYNGWGLKVGNVFKVEPKLAGYIDNSFAEQAVKNLQ